VSPVRNVGTRRFAAVWAVSVLWKVAALAVFVVVVVKLTGGGGL